jgi:hypothetical protein
MHPHPAKVVSHALAHLRLNGPIQRLPAPTGMVNATGRTLIKFKRTIFTSLGNQTLYGLIAH